MHTHGSFSGFSHQGVAANSRKSLTAFGSPWKRLLKFIRPEPGYNSMLEDIGQARWGLGSVFLLQGAWAASQAPQGKKVGSLMSEWLGYGMAALPGAIIGGLAGFPQIGAMASAMLFQGTISRNISVGVSGSTISIAMFAGSTWEAITRTPRWPGPCVSGLPRRWRCPHAREGEPLPSPI